MTIWILNTIQKQIPEAIQNPNHLETNHVLTSWIPDTISILIQTILVNVKYGWMYKIYLFSVELDENEIPDFKNIWIVHVDQVSGVSATWNI